jgi:hypothetical protein
VNHPHGQQPVPAVDPVSRVPYHQHTYADGTTTAPNWNPVEHDSTNIDNANRSWDATQRQLNPFGDPTHPRKQRENFDLPPEPVAKVSFANGQKRVHYGDDEQLPVRGDHPVRIPERGSSSPRRLVVGASNASVKLYGK